MSTKTNAALREKWTNLVKDALTLSDEYEVLPTSSHQLAIPVVDDEGEDNWVVITITVPTGTRDGDVYDGYGLAETYQINKANAEAKAKAAAEKKAAKIARDQKMREQKEALKASRNSK